MSYSGKPLGTQNVSTIVSSNTPNSFGTPSWEQPVGQTPQGVPVGQTPQGVPVAQAPHGDQELWVHYWQDNGPPGAGPVVVFLVEGKGWNPRVHVRCAFDFYRDLKNPDGADGPVALTLDSGYFQAYWVVSGVVETFNGNFKVSATSDDGKMASADAMAYT